MWHLRKNAKAALKRHDITAPKQYLMRRLDTAFLRPEGWEEFKDKAAGYLHVAAWCAGVDSVVTAQTAARWQLGPGKQHRPSGPAHQTGPSDA